MGHVQIWRHILFYQKILKYFNDFQNRNFSVLWLKWTQTMKMKQNQTFIHRAYLNLISFLFAARTLKYFKTFIIGIFQSSFNKWVQTKIKIKRGMCKSDSIFVIYKMVHYLNDFWDLFLAKVFLKMNDKQLRRKNLFRLIQFGKY